MKLHADIKNFIDSRKYRNALDLFDHKHQIATGPTITLAIKAAAILRDHKAGIRIHQHLTEQSRKDPWIQSSLIHFYMQCNDVANAEKVFSSIEKKTVFMYGAMFKGYISNEQPEKVIELFRNLSIEPDRVMTLLFFNACAKHMNDESLKLATNVLKRVPADLFADVKLMNSAIDMLMKCGEVKQAEDVFRSVKRCDASTRTILMQGYLDHSMPEKALDLFEEIRGTPDNFAFRIAIDACSALRNERAVRIGNELVRRLSSTFGNNAFVVGSMLNMLTKFGRIKDAEKLFHSGATKSIISYGIMIKGYIDNHLFDQAFDLFENLPDTPDDGMCMTIIEACTTSRNERAIRLGNQLVQQLRQNSNENLRLMNVLITMLMKFGQVEQAEDLFRSLQKKDMFSYGAMMQGCVENDVPEKALDLFEEMTEAPDQVILTIVCSACAVLCDERGRQLGNNLLKDIKKSSGDLILIGSAINMLMRFGQVEQAEDLFANVKTPDVAMYGIMMHGYNSNDRPQSSLMLFDPMKQHGLVPNLSSCLGLINAASLIGLRPICETAIDQIPPQYLDDPQMKNALMNMWGKALVLDEALKMFQSVSQPDTITFNTMINAYARNGCGPEAVQLYHSMPEQLKDNVSHICVINACSHAGLVDQARTIYENIDVKTEQIITTMIDCLSRMFIFDAAQDLISQYEQTHPPSPIMYMALLSGARSARRSDLAQSLYSRMQTLFPNNRPDLIAASILVSNTYTSVGEYAQSADVRDHRVKTYGGKGEPGVTWTLVNGQITDFRAHDTSHPRSREIYVKGEEMLAKIKELGYVPDRSWVTRPLQNDETHESVLCGHSERLAIAFNLIQEPQPTVIYLTKNLRICPDCHQATKLIAKAYECEIIARDANRGHHFYKNGECSCSDHF